MQTLNLSFFHDGKKWVVRDEGISVTGKDLAELDANLRTELSNQYQFPPGTKLEVNMDFDYSTIPDWMREYHTYYIHRNLEFAF